MAACDLATREGLLAVELPYRDPLEAFAAFAEDPSAVFLDSAQTSERLGRYSFIAAEPFQTLTAKNGVVTLGDRRFAADPFDVLDQELRKFPVAAREDLPPFQGGAAGYFGYELGRQLEALPLPAEDDMAFPDMALGFFDTVIAFDHRERKTWILSSGYPERAAAARQQRAEARAGRFREHLESANKVPAPAVPAEVAVTANFSREAYEAAVQRVIDYIHAGDIFQANLSQRFSFDLPDGMTPLDLYGRLRAVNPAPFAAYLRFGDVALASSSPERFLKLRGGRVETRPIKGTRPRGRTPRRDDDLALELLSSEKDRAENVMIVDLLRNDLSRVCRDRSVEVPELCVLETYATVLHLVSTVVGELRPGVTAVDLLKACFPGGSITGAPKIRAMEIIAELEPNNRGPYCGAVGYLAFTGDMDSNIVIRSYAIRDRQATFQAGGGIVADSDPAREYQETLDKAEALRQAIFAGNR